MFIVFESIDGGGTTTQTKLLADAIGWDSAALPSDSDLGKLIRASLRGERYCTKESLAHLFVADHFEFSTTEILNRKKDNVPFIVDRWLFSTFAYQRDIINWFFLYDNVLEKLPVFPDITFFLRISAEAADKRMNASRSNREFYENLNFQKKLVKNYRDCLGWLFNNEARFYSKRDDSIGKLVIIDGTQSIEAIHQEVLQYVNKELDKHHGGKDGSD